MPTRVDLPKDLVRSMLEQAESLRNRQIKAATNNLIKEALQSELGQITQAKNTLADTK